VVVGSLAMVLPRDHFLSPVPDGQGSYERGSRSALIYRLELFFRLTVLPIWEPGHNSVPGNVTIFFYYNDGILFHIMGFRVLLIHFGTWT